MCALFNLTIVFDAFIRNFFNKYTEKSSKSTENCPTYFESHFSK